jgi:uncharacterized protein (TIGR02246 family)
MRKSMAMLFALALVALAADLWAGPVEEVAQIAAPRGKVFEEGTAEAYSAPFADNAVLTSSLSGPRIEGKEAIRAYFSQLFQLYPGRRLFTRQSAARAYNDDLVIQNGYFVTYWTDQKGDVTQLELRGSVVWAKVGGRWQIVEQHVSRFPKP